MKIAAYLRVSTKDQKVDIQLDSIKKYCEFKGWINPVLFIDHAESGKKESRPQFDMMMERVRLKEFDILLCWKFDRIGRSTIHLMTIMGELKELSVSFVSIMENVDTTTAIGKLFFSFLASMAEFERDTIRTRTMAGVKSAKQKGVKFGAPCKISKDIKKDILYLKCQGQSVNQLVSTFNVSRAQIYRIIKNEVYSD